MKFYYQKKVTRGNNGAYYYVEESGYRRYVCFWDCRPRNIPTLFLKLPKEINEIIWNYKRQLECSTLRWDSFLMSLTAAQYSHFRIRVKRHPEHLNVKQLIHYTLFNFPINSRIYKKAEKQLLNY